MRRAGAARLVDPSGSRKSGEEHSRRGIVAKGAAEVGEAIDIAWTEDKTAAELKRVLAQTVLAKPGGLRPLSRTLVVAPEEMKQ